ncbi:DUF3300 domain-containing protein [Methylomicrobium sp. Wu6]|uniref:DUF3300 domain-containing protein n=1 Tax=Methylomicrobium sp. Wu6 TaxID=3107928 RepID=UPI002DD69C00|nr:DUF3300 domain-containing protein [Methylomicrobium sp. Wu6]MEC4747243.1 DUF3300 domain-containing protein [Methylomicrobium sp. Wu6]
MNQINNPARRAHLPEIVGGTVHMCAKGRAMANVQSTKRKSALTQSAGIATLRGGVARAVLLIIAMHAAGCGDKDKEKTQTPPVPSTSQPTQPQPTTPPVPKPEAKPLTSLESLVAPIALYPDPLLAEVLVASTYPLEVVQAARWLESKPDPATVRDQKWDASIVRLTAVPDVIAMMDQHLDWTTQLGDAFLSNPSQLMDAVQALRKRATDAGFLKDSDFQKVETKTVSAPVQGLTETPGAKVTPAVLTKEVITIQPAKADTISVPSYNPEVVYAAPMAPPPATSQMYPAAPAASYYPTYYPQPAATTTTTTSSGTDQLMSFGAGALVGGLLTWGIMEWAHDDDDWDDYHVSHYYGDAVCRGGNCWHGGGGYYGGGGYANINRGNINVDRDFNMSGNEININRDGTFKPDQLPALKDRTNRWQPDARHRRGQAFPAQAQQRIGRAESPALAGNRLSGAQNLPADMRGFGKGDAADRSTPSRLSSADIQQRLAAKPGAAVRPGDSRAQPFQSSRENALEGLRASGQRSNFESQRGASSLGSRQQVKGQSRAKDLAAPTPRRSENGAALGQRRSEPAMQRPNQQQQLARQRNEQMQRMQSQRHQEMARPNAFYSARDGGRVNSFSNRGSASLNRGGAGFARPQPAMQTPSFGGQRGGGGAMSRGGAARGRGGRR